MDDFYTFTCAAECHKCFKDIELALQTIEEEPLKLLMSNLRVRTKEALLALLPLKGEDKLDSLPVLSYAAKSLGCQMVLNNSAAAQLLKLIQAAEAAKGMCHLLSDWLGLQLDPP